MDKVQDQMLRWIKLAGTNFRCIMDFIAIILSSKGHYYSQTLLIAWDLVNGKSQSIGTNGKTV